VTETFEKAVVSETHSEPIITETVERTRTIGDSSHTHGQGHLAHGEGHFHGEGARSHGTDVIGGAQGTQTSVYSATGSAQGVTGVQGNIGLQGSAGAPGTTYVHETLVKDGELLEDEEWVVEDNGVRTKKKRGFFAHLKDKITGHHPE
jgi:hypothetical protein